MSRRETDVGTHSSTAFTPLPFALRPMREEDLPAILAIERESFPSPWTDAAYRYELRHKPESRFYVLEPVGRLGLKLLGYTGVRLHPHRAHIITIAVNPLLRGRGLGKFLLLTVLDIAARNNVPQVTLEVRVSNLVAQQLYFEVGFVRTGFQRCYYRDGEDAWLMALAPLDDRYRARLQGMLQQVITRLAHDTLLWGEQRATNNN